jgi:hypothetical protein
LRHWAYDAVQKLVEAGMIIGYPDDTFKGGRGMTRYEFAAALVRLLLDRLPTVWAGVVLPERVKAVTISVDGEVLQNLAATDDRSWVGLLVLPRPSSGTLTGELRISVSDRDSYLVGWRAELGRQPDGTAAVALTVECPPGSPKLELAQVPGVDGNVARTAEGSRQTWRFVAKPTAQGSVTVLLKLHLPGGEAQITLELPLPPAK